MLVHGPLLAILLVQAVERSGIPVKAIEYRAMAPVFDVDAVPVRLGTGDGGPVAEITKDDGTLAMTLTAVRGRS